MQAGASRHFLGYLPPVLVVALMNGAVLVGCCINEVGCVGWLVGVPFPLPLLKTNERTKRNESNERTYERTSHVKSRI